MKKLVRKYPYQGVYYDHNRISYDSEYYNHEIILVYKKYVTWCDDFRTHISLGVVE